MTIVHARIYYCSANAKLALKLSRTHWGFADWFVRRLKPIKQQLRGPETKGVNIVNFLLHDDHRRATRLLEWWQCANTFEYAFPFDLKSLVRRPPLANIEELMPLTSEIAALAPWPQVRAIGRALATPLFAEDKKTLLPFLKWPRKLDY